MSTMTILSEMVKDTARIKLQEEYGKHFVKLEEPQAADSSAIIKGIPADAVIIKVDAFRSPDDVFNGNKGECKRADFVIISGEKKCVVYIEIKRTKDSWDQIVKQLTGAECFIKYCQEIGKSFWKDKSFLQDFKHRFVSIGHTSIAKRKTQVTKNADKHDTPQKALKIDWPNYLQFNQLVGA
ncbi:MAG: hypothetical protein ACOYL3_19355 [Desulfuromonadaceae bacterium]